MFVFNKKIIMTSPCFMHVQIEDASVEHMRRQLDGEYGRPGHEQVTESWDTLQKLVSVHTILQYCVIKMSAYF